MTDVTGFGLLGHLTEMAEGSGLSAELDYASVKRTPGVEDYIKQKTIPGATARNWNSYSNKIQFESTVDAEEARLLLPDPQTNGGLLIAVDENAVDDIKRVFSANGLQLFLEPIGKCINKKEKVVYVQ